MESAMAGKEGRVGEWTPSGGDDQPRVMPSTFVDRHGLIYAVDESFPQLRNTSIARELLNPFR
jgi:hypothetical protein